MIIDNVVIDAITTRYCFRDFPIYYAAALGMRKYLLLKLRFVPALRVRWPRFWELDILMDCPSCSDNVRSSLCVGFQKCLNCGKCLRYYVSLSLSLFFTFVSIINRRRACNSNISKCNILIANWNTHTWFFQCSQAVLKILTCEIFFPWSTRWIHMPKSAMCLPRTAWCTRRPGRESSSLDMLCSQLDFLNHHKSN